MNTLGFLGFWITLYGLIVAILEIARTGSVTSQVARAAEASHNKLKQQIEHGETEACQELINLVLEDLIKKKAVSTIIITRIKQVYISRFSKGNAPERYHDNLEILDSYEHVAQSRGKKTGPNPMYDTSQYPKANVAASEHPHKFTIDALKRMQNDLLAHSVAKHDYVGEPV
ncbi:hypothetical protein C163_06800 [Pseudomonas sp. FGI182]|uniref:hypothetical protein n=1 Tax=Pseudomonas sp. FGI182 TaxID=1259844 RepID=UPI0003D8ED02|nr:hypothetical protein [Pseudomonas sp. FGI182]AHD17198.1 hypothetical protein C163_06800 [Pseudomonas sp. FGI182]